MTFVTESIQNMNKQNLLLDLYDKEIKNRTEFLEVALKNLEDIDKAIDDTNKKSQSIQNTIDSIKSLSKHPQAKSYLKICSLAYVDALVQHTGEYNVEMGSEYQCTLTKEQTIEYLEDQLTGVRSTLPSYDNEKEQIKRRFGFNFDDVDNIPDVEDMPEKIISDKGIALKQGFFYEIIEHAEPVEKVEKKRISRIK